MVKSIKAFILALFFLLSNSADAHDSKIHQTDSYLIIASYNPDTRRMSDFITSFQMNLLKENDKAEVLIEDMGCKNFYTEAHTWPGQVANLLKKYNNKNIKALILLGQESWASFLHLASEDSSIVTRFRNVPVYSAFVSENGIDLPNVINDTEWRPFMINMVSKAQESFDCGGFVNTYDVKENINLIKSFYPNTRNIAFITDNTYGGTSLTALVRKELEAYPELTYIGIDGRRISASEAKENIRNLPANTAVLIGTWRVNNEGQYFLRNSLEELFTNITDIPVFSLTGSGIGSVAIGGYIPNYGANAEMIVRQITRYNHGDKNASKFEKSTSYFSFDRRKVEKLGVRPDQLPANSSFIDTEDPQLRKYRTFLIALSGGSAILIIFAVLFALLYKRNKRLRQNLQKNEKELIIAKERAEESDRLKSSFLANMSHEIRTPLNAIVGFSQLMGDENCTTEEKAKFADVISQNSDMLLTLISDIIDISRLDTGKMNFVYKKIPLKEFVERFQNTTLHLNKPDIEYIYKFDSSYIILNTDIHRLSQVMINLFTNANKFTEKGTITMEYKVEKEKNRILFTIEDTGSGIPLDKQNRLFERFEKLDEYKQGAGLGLAISRQIINHLGGEIWIDPDYTGGAKFCFTHPL